VHCEYSDLHDSGNIYVRLRTEKFNSSTWNLRWRRESGTLGARTQRRLVFVAVGSHRCVRYRAVQRCLRHDCHCVRGWIMMLISDIAELINAFQFESWGKFLLWLVWTGG
jgi:hypothetical protein